MVFDQARKAVLKQTQGHYPAPLAAIEVMEYGLDHGLDAGLAFEAKRFGEIATTPVAKNLLHIFCADLALSETQYSDHPPQDITTVGILGGGLMGAGIGTVSLFNAKKKVIVKDRDADGIANANKHIKGAADRKLQFNSITEAEHRTFLENYRGVIDYAALTSCDMIIEAVFEDLSLKHQIVEDIESHCNEQTIFASNTSSLSVADIAAHAKRPENILAMHYFSPVEKMPLLEIVKHEGTSDTAIATAVELGRQQGKKVIVVKDGAGFYVNRMLFPYANEIAWMALEGVPLDVLDKTMQEAGFPVGPISLLDEVGFDIAAKVQNNLETGFGHRFTAPNLLPKLIEDGRLGRKSRKGMYLYDQDTGKKLKEIDPLIYSLMGVKPTHSIPEDTLKLRAILPMLNEAVRCLEDGTIASPIDGDIGAIFGVGFIPFSGGPFKLIDSMSAGAVVNQLQRHEEEFGARFTPCDLLVEHARKAKTFY